MEEVYTSDKIKVYKTIEENVTRLTVAIDDFVYICDITNELITDEFIDKLTKLIIKTTIKSALEAYYNVDEIVEKVVENL